MKIKTLMSVTTTFFLLFLTGCNFLGSTPTSEVEELLGKYQRNEEEIKLEVDDILSKEDMKEDQRERYKKIILDQYQSLSYDVKEEEINGNIATVTVQIEVLDYRKQINKLETEYSSITNYDLEEYTNKKLDYLEGANEKVQYTIEFTCTKDDEGNWKLNNLSNSDLQKIQGMY